MIEMVGTGGAHMMINSPLVYQGWNKNYQIFSLPFLFPDQETGFKAMKTEKGKEALHWMEANGMVGVGVVQNGYRQLTTNTGKPITSPADMKGLKLRIPDSPLLIATFTAMGASPVSLNMTEVYTSIQQGTVDGQENPIAVIDSNKIYEVAPYITVWTYNWDPAFIMCNKALLDSFTEEQRTLFQECIDETADYIIKMIDDNEAKQLQGFKDAGCTVTVLTEEQTKAFKDITAKVYDECRKNIGAELVDGFANTVKELANK
jgi:tripartite ATP-independent transporter DctP family solute receptor